MEVTARFMSPTVWFLFFSQQMMGKPPPVEKSDLYRGGGQNLPIASM